MLCSVTCFYFLKDGVPYCDDGGAGTAVKCGEAANEKTPELVWAKVLTWAPAVDTGGAKPGSNPPWANEPDVGAGGDNCGGTKFDSLGAMGGTRAAKDGGGAGRPYRWAGGANLGGPYTCAGKIGVFAWKGGAYWPDIKAASPKIITALKERNITVRYRPTYN